MRVLWFSINSGCYNSKISTAHNGGGWVSSLEKIISKRDDIQLGIAFEYKSNKFKDTINGVDYYPINVRNGSLYKLHEIYSISNEEKRIIPKCIKIIEDFKPDIIQCFGSEWCYGLIVQHTKVPVVIHMQGSMPSYFNALYPPKYSKYSRLLFEISHFHFKKVISLLFYEKVNKQRTEREIRILKANKYFLGRTDWDMTVTRLFSPISKYFICNEALRNSFGNTTKHWNPQKNEFITLCTVSNGSLWKGLDVILKTAHILKKYTDFKFRWLLIGGINNKKYIEWMENLLFKDNNVEFLGILKEVQLKDVLLSSDIYIHPAYIDNSPNALCEAMFLGVPCIASYVGGIPSLIQDGKSGILVPVNEPYYLAEKIISLSRDKNKQKELSETAMISARIRHSSENIEKELITAYKKIIQDSHENHI